MLIAKLCLFSNIFTKLHFGKTLEDKISDEDFTLGFWQKRSSIFSHNDSKLKLGVFDENQNDLSKNI